MRHAPHIHTQRHAIYACMHALDAYNYIERYQRLARYLSEAIKLSEMGIMCSDGTGKVLLSVAIAMANEDSQAMAMCHVSASLRLAFDIRRANCFLRCYVWGVSGNRTWRSQQHHFLKIFATRLTTTSPIERCNYSL